MSSPRVLAAPPEPIVVLTQTQTDEVLRASRASERRRAILPFHKHHGELLHRMFNAVQPGTYVRPHRHMRSQKSEAFVVLRGALDFLAFDEDGALIMAQRLAAGGDAFGIDIDPSCYHSFLVCAPDTLLYEVKTGPYTASDDKDFASWAPAEGTPEVAPYLAGLEQAARHRQR